MAPERVEESNLKGVRVAGNRSGVKELLWLCSLRQRAVFSQLSSVNACAAPVRTPRARTRAGGYADVVGSARRRLKLLPRDLGGDAGVEVKLPLPTHHTSITIARAVTAQSHLNNGSKDSNGAAAPGQGQHRQ